MDARVYEQFLQEQLAASFGAPRQPCRPAQALSFGREFGPVRCGVACCASPRRLSGAVPSRRRNAMIWTARTALSVSLGLAFALAAPAALAQDTTGTAAGTGTAEGTLPPPKVTTQVQTTTTTTPAKA